jgi:hypothetical protein
MSRLRTSLSRLRRPGNMKRDDIRASVRGTSASRPSSSRRVTFRNTARCTLIHGLPRSCARWTSLNRTDTRLVRAEFACSVERPRVIGFQGLEPTSASRQDLGDARRSGSAATSLTNKSRMLTNTLRLGTTAELYLFCTCTRHFERFCRHRAIDIRPSC